MAIKILHYDEDVEQFAKDIKVDEGGTYESIPIHVLNVETDGDMVTVYTDSGFYLCMTTFDVDQIYKALP